MEIAVKVPEGEAGDWKVEKFTITKQEAGLFNINCHGRGVDPGTYKRLMRCGTVVMSNTPIEIDDFRYFLRIASGKVLVAGLGLGVVLEGLLKNENIKHIDVVEKSEDVIKLVSPTFKRYKHVHIMNEDIFWWNPGECYDFGWFDIWDTITSDNLPEMTKLKRKFARRIKQKFCWCEDICRQSR